MSTDSRLSFDLTAEDLDTGFKLTPEGWYQVEIDDCDENESSNGNPQYIVKYKSLDESFKGTIWDYVTITQAAIQNIHSLVRATGFPVPTKDKPGKFVIPETDELIGKELQIEIIHEGDWKGATDDDGNVIKRAKVRFGGRKKIGEKVGKAPAKATTAKAATGAKAKANASSKTATEGFSL